MHHAETKQEFDSINGIVGNLLIMYDQHFSICYRNGLGIALIVKFDREFSKFFLAWIATVLNSGSNTKWEITAATNEAKDRGCI